MKSCDGNHFHGCHGLIQEDSHSEIRKSHLLKTSNIFGKNLKQYVIPYTEEKPYSCGICGKEFVRSFNLKIHQRIHTGEKPYSCVACGKEFITNSNMKKHNVIHTGEKPYSCVVCGKYFGSRSYIKMHERIHSGEKPYTCILCGKQFGRSSQLTTHERIHTGEKPYSCVLCGKQFGRSGQLRRHQRIHTAFDVSPFLTKNLKRKYTESQPEQRWTLVQLLDWWLHLRFYGNGYFLYFAIFSTNRTESTLMKH
ncbi:uncharacterized protein LOC143223674 isoform X1 [Tachypleus tridentatus]|uniref:uncharacterized protein LOC143223674 isoform X1 n=1 Tax=Tachypleus tridentatus TaxID=6853 RepID=UPI003FD5ED75